MTRDAQLVMGITPIAFTRRALARSMPRAQRIERRNDAGSQQRGR